MAGQPSAAASARLALLAGVLGLLFNAFTWGVSWWPFRQLQDAGPASAVGHGADLPAGGAVHQRCGARPVGAQLLRAPALWWLVLASGTTNAAFNWGVTIGDVVRVVLLFYLMPLWAVMLARLVLGEHLTPLAGVRVLLALTGAAIVLWPQGAALPLPGTLAEGLGVLGGFAFALNNVMLRRESHQPELARALAMFLGGAVVAGLLALALGAQGLVPPPPPPAWPWMAGALGLGAMFLLSNLTLQYGAARLSANATAVVMVTEVLFASVSALLLGAGQLSLPLVAGGVLIVSAALLSVFER